MGDLFGDFIDFIKFFWLPFVIIIGVLGLALVATYFAQRAECSLYEQQTGRNTEFFLFGGCYVEHGGKKIPYGEFKARAVTNEEAP